MATSVRRTIGQGSEGTLVTTMAMRWPAGSETAGFGTRPRPNTKRKYEGAKVTQPSTALFTTNQNMSSSCAGSNHHHHKRASAATHAPSKSRCTSRCRGVNVGIRRSEEIIDYLETEESATPGVNKGLSRCLGFSRSGCTIQGSQ
jgi:hypothetical protein